MKRAEPIAEKSETVFEDCIFAAGDGGVFISGGGGVVVEGCAFIPQQAWWRRALRWLARPWQSRVVTYGDREGGEATELTARVYKDGRIEVLDFRRLPR